MSISSDFVVPHSSLHRLKLPKEQQNAIRSAPDAKKEQALVTIIDDFIQKSKLQKLKSEVESINGFRVIFSCSTTSGTGLVGKQLEDHNPDISFQRNQVDYVIFFVRALPGKKLDIYAATRGSNMPQVIKHLTNYKFPWKVAKRHLSPTLLEIKTKHLIGSILQSSLTFYGIPSFSLLQLQSQFVTHFTTRFREHSSIYCQFEDHKLEKAMTVDVNMKSIRINSQLDLSDYSKILIHLSKLYQKEPTFECKHFIPAHDQIAEEDDESFLFLDLVVRSPIQKREELEHCLLKRLWEIYEQPKNPSDLRFWHRYSDDYLRSGEFTLYHGEKEIYKWTAPPLLSDVLLAIKSFKEIKSQKDFIQELSKLKMEFQFSGRPYREGLIRFLEAEVRTSEGEIYFRNHGIWLEVSSEYLMLVQSDFRTNINACLIPRSSEAQLHIPWMSQIEWAGTTWKEVREKIGETVQSEQGIEEVWSQLKPFTNPLTKDGKLKRKRTEEEPIEKKQRITKQTSITRFAKPLTPQTILLPGEEESFVISQKPEGFLQPFQAFLEEKYQLYQDFKREGEYNALYIGEPDFFVGDRITPNGIELFDLMKQVGGDLYLYQVKESISEVTTKACSQLRNAAEALSAALLHPRSSSNILRKFWTEASSEKKDPYFKKLTTFYQAYSLEEFLQLFNRDRKKICFVLAFHDDRKKEVEIAQEGKFETVLSPKDFNNISPKMSGEEIYQRLLDHGYINANGQASISFAKLKSGHFDLGKEINTHLTTRIFYKIYRKMTAFQSTLAKVDITLTRKIIEELGFTFRICQIYRPANVANASSGEESLAWEIFSQHVDREEVKYPKTQYSIDGLNYVTLSTPGDGSCGLHALRGAVIGNECYISEGNPKEDFVKKIREELDDPKFLVECQMDLLEKALSLNPSNEAKMAYPSELFEPFQLEYQSVENKQFIQKQELRKEEGRKWVALINKSPKVKKFVMECIFPTRSHYFQCLHEEDIETLMNWVDGERQEISKSFSSDQLSEIHKLHEERMDDHIIQEMKESFLSQSKVIDAYFTAIQQPSYYLSTQEILLAAKLYNIRCRIYIKKEGGEVVLADEHPLESENEILIFHHFPFSQHFSRLHLFD